jgi:hypothetical protein
VDHAGFCNNSLPLKAQPLDQVLAGLQSRHDNEKIHFERGDQDKWEQTVRSIQEQLRTTWERAVEEALAPVLRRMSNKVDTKGLKKLTVLTLQDCESMREAFGRCSRLLHSDASALNSPLPRPEAVQAEVTALKQWVDDLRGRQRAV